METPIVVIDASVSRKWFNNEDETDSALKIRKAIEDEKISVVEPELFIYETSAGINKNLQLEINDKLKCVNMLYDIIDVVAHIYHRMNEIMEIAIDKKLTIYDACYYLVAKENDGFLIHYDSDFDKLNDDKILRLGSEEYEEFIESLEEEE